MDPQVAAELLELKGCEHRSPISCNILSQPIAFKDLPDHPHQLPSMQVQGPVHQWPVGVLVHIHKVLGTNDLKVVYGEHLERVLLLLHPLQGIPGLAEGLLCAL